MDPMSSNSVRHIGLAVKKTCKLMEKKQELQSYNVPIRELSHSLKCLRSILHEFYCRNTAAPRQAIGATALSDIKSLLQEINLFFALPPISVHDIINQVHNYQRRVTEKIILFQNVSLNGELTVTQSLLLTVGLLSPRMPLLRSGPTEEEHHQQLMQERKILNSLNTSDALHFMSSPIREGLFVGYYIYNHEPIIGGGGPTRLFLRFDLKIKILQEGETSDLTGHFRLEMGQFDNALHTASVRNYSFVKTYGEDHFPWQVPANGDLRLCVQKWQFGGQWKDQNLDMDSAECLGNFLLDELHRDVISIDGAWCGFYFTGAEPEPSDQPFHLTIETTTRTSEGFIVVTGEGTDQHGVFDIRGHLFQDRLLKKLEFRKTYYSIDPVGARMDRFGWDYKGLVEAGGRGVTGSWGVGSSPQGSFAMARLDQEK